MKRQSTSKLLRLMVAVFALFLLVMAGSVLSACGGEVTEQPNNAEVHKHTYGQPEHTAIAKCGSTGYDVYTCTECGDRYAIVTAATGQHDFKDGVCTVCGISTAGYDDKSLREYLKTELDKINAAVGKITSPEAAHNHNFETTVKTVEPTCLSIGLTVKKCKCGSTTVEDLKDPLKHDYVPSTEEGSKIAPTCTTDGQIKMVCKNCNDTYWAVDDSDEGRATGHKFERTTKEADKPANCITPKLLAYECKNCGEIEYQQFDNVLDKTRHSDSTKAEDLYSFIPETGDKGWHKWPTTGDTAIPNAPTKLPEGMKEPTSTLDVYWAQCPACNEIVWKTQKVDCQHEWEALEKNVAPTCETDGLFNAKCKKCGQFANQLPTGSRTGTLTFELNDELVGDQTTENGGFIVDPMIGHKLADGTVLVESYEVDRKDGKPITSDTDKTANTTSWDQATCANCGHKLAVAKGAGENKEDLFLDISGYVAKDESSILDKFTEEFKKDFLQAKKDAYKEEHKDDEDGQKELTGEALTKAEEAAKTEAEALAGKFFTRAWHAWRLYNPKAPEAGKEAEKNVKLDSGKVLVPPEKAAAPDYETCIKAGTYWYYCIDASCSEHKVETDANQVGRWITVTHKPLGHNWVQVKNENGDKKPTCTESGEITFECKNSYTQEGKEGNGATWTCNAKIKVSLDGDKVDQKTKDEHFFENFWRLRDDTKEEGQQITFAEGYVDLWKSGLTIERQQKNGKDDPNAGTNDEILKALTDAQKVELTKAVMPQGHIWVVDEEETKKLGTRTCYDGGTTIYKCDCKAVGNSTCCTHEETKADGTKETKTCPQWKKAGEFKHIDTDESGKPVTNTAKFIIYGYCGTNHTHNGQAHQNYEVTYCTYCYAIIDIVELKDASGALIENFHHFPFQREKLFKNMLSASPLPANTTLKQIMENPTLLKEAKITDEDVGEVGSYFNKRAEANRLAREEFVKTWIEIEQFWFKKEGKASDYDHLTNYITLRNGKFECDDCYELLDEFTDMKALHDRYSKTDMYGKLKWALWYYVKDENGTMIKVTEGTKSTYNACEYQYYSQYEVWYEENGKREFTWYSSLNHLTKKDWDKMEHTENNTALDLLDAMGKYNAESVDSKGKEVTPTGTHYLVPAKDYSDLTKHPNFKRDAKTNVVTMDWVCVFCGTTFELQVEYDATATNGAANVKLHKADPTRVLLVDMSGIRFGDKTLNQRADNSTPDKIFQRGGAIYAQDTLDADLTGNVNKQWKYVAKGTVILTTAHGKSGICVAHRENMKKDGTVWSGSNDDYFEDSKGKYCTDKTLYGSLLDPADFADPTEKRTGTAKTLFEKIWDSAYSTAGLDNSSDSNGDKRLAVATRLDNLLREGGEIVVGGDLQDVRKMNASGGSSGSEWTWDTITPAAEEPMTLDAAATPTQIFPLGTFDQKSGGTYATNKKVNEKTHYTPVLFLDAGTVLDLNGHTLYANVWVGAVNSSGADIAFGSDGYDHSMTAGDVTIKNGTIIMSSSSRIQVEGEHAHLTLENVEISGSEVGICAYNGATITVKDSNLITKGYALNSNNCKQKDTGTLDNTGGQGSANFYLENSAFISTESTAFFMPAKGNIEATDCEFYGYNMGVYLRGHDLEEKAAVSGGTASHATFEKCLFAKGDQAAGSTKNDQGTNTKHFGALTIGNDNTNTNYGSIKGLYLTKCDFEIVHVAKIPTTTPATSTTTDTVWTPDFVEANDGWDLKEEVASAGCPTSSSSSSSVTGCTDETCCHRAIVLNIYGCADKQNCMNGTDECTNDCGSVEKGKGDGNLTLHIDKDTLTNLINHARKFFKHKGVAADGSINPFLGCTFTEGAALLGKCCKLKIYLISETVGAAEIELNWTKPDGQDLKIPQA